MASNNEGLILSGFNINDFVKTVTEAMTFTPAQPKAELAENPNVSGVLLVEEPQYTSAYFDMQIRVVQAADLDTALEVAGEIMDALQSCARTEGGAPLEWTPNTTTTTYMAFALLAELQELPVTPTGELAGWFIRSPVLKVRITCRPFLHTPERTVVGPITSSEPLQIMYVAGIKGDVPAEARLLITDKAAQERKFLEWGQDLVETEVNPSIHLGLPTFSVTGFAGSSTVRAGSTFTNVVTASIKQFPKTICSTGKIENVGDFIAKLRIEVPTSEGIMFRISYRTGDGRFTTLPWVSIEDAGAWIDVQMGEVFLDEAEKGEQVSEVRIEGQIQPGSFVTGATIYIDGLDLIPAKRHAIAHAPPLEETPSSSSEAKPPASVENSLGIGSVAWVNPANAVSSNNVYATATMTSGAPTNYLYAKSFGLAIPATATVVGVEFVVERKATFPTYLFENNRLVVAGVVKSFIPEISGTKFSESDALYVIGGPTSTFGSALVGTDVNNAGFGIALAFRSGSGLVSPVVSIDSVTMNVYFAENAVANCVCATSKSVEITSEGATRQDVGGTFWSNVPRYRGSDLFLDPAGSDKMINRVAVKMRRLDTQSEPDTNLKDSQSLQLNVIERFLAPR